MKVTYGGGPVLSNVEVVLVWVYLDAVDNLGVVHVHDPRTSGDWVPMTEEFFADILDSAYMDLLGKEYSIPNGQTIGRGKLVGSYFIKLPHTLQASSENVESAELTDLLAAGVAAGTLPPPSPNTLYYLLIPEEATLLPTVGGWHSMLTEEQMGFPVYFAIIASYKDSIALAHELVEAVTDPKVGEGWVALDQGEEIGDLCDKGTASFFHGYEVCEFWLNSTDQCSKIVDDHMSNLPITIRIQAKPRSACFAVFAEQTWLEFTGTAQRGGLTLPKVGDWFTDGYYYAYPLSGTNLPYRVPAAGTPFSITYQLSYPDGSAIAAHTEHYLSVTAEQFAEHQAWCQTLRRVRTIAKSGARQPPLPLWDPLRDFGWQPITGAELHRAKEFASQLLSLIDQSQRLEMGSHGNA